MGDRQGDEFGNFVRVMRLEGLAEGIKPGPSCFDEQEHLFPRGNPVLPPVPGLDVWDEVYTGGEPFLQNDARKPLSFSEGAGCDEYNPERISLY